MSHPFLSDEWMAAANEVRAKYESQAAPFVQPIRINQVITDAPFGEGTIRLFIDTSSGALHTDHGELDGPDCTITTDYETARKILVDADQAAAMQAFMSGRIKVQGDMMKMIALQTALAQDPLTGTIAGEIQAITA